MTDKAGANWTKRNVMVAIGFGLATMLCMTVTTAPTWVPFVAERGYDAAWLMPSVRLVQRWWRVVFAGAGLVLVGALLWWFRRQVIRPFKWLGGLGKRFYLWVLWEVVVRPARDHWGVVVGEDAGVGVSALERAAGGGRGGLEETLVGLSAKALRVLGRVLVRYDPALGRTVVWQTSPDDQHVLSHEFHEDFGALQRAACQELVEAGLFSNVRFALRREASVTIDLDQRVLDAGVLRVRELVEEELRMR